MTDIDEIGRVLRGRYGRKSIAGLTSGEIEEVRLDQAVDDLPAEWRKFLSVMGRRAGGLLLGTDVFHPGILGAKREALEAHPPLRDLPGDTVVIGMHQGYQFYVMRAPVPDVTLYTEGDDAAVHHWPSLTVMLEDELSTLFRVEALIGESVLARRAPRPERPPSAFVRWRRRGQL